MSKLGFAALAVVTIVTATTFAPPIEARDRYEDGYRYRNHQVAQRVYDSYGAVRSRRDPSSLDGRRTGQPRNLRARFLTPRWSRLYDRPILQLTDHGAALHPRQQKIKIKFGGTPERVTERSGKAMSAIRSISRVKRKTFAQSEPYRF